VLFGIFFRFLERGFNHLKTDKFFPKILTRGWAFHYSLTISAIEHILEKLISLSHTFWQSNFPNVSYRLFAQDIATLYFSLISDPTVPHINGCRSSNKQFSVDCFLDWKGRHWVSSVQTTTPH